MVHPCIVKDCKNKSRDGIFRFPREPELRDVWVANLDLDPGSLNDLSRVCGRHFTESDFRRDLKGELLGTPSRRKFLLTDAVPSLESQLAAVGGSSSRPPPPPPARKRLVVLRRTLVPIYGSKQFKREKEVLLAQIKAEAARNVKEKRKAAGREQRRRQQQQCVLLQPPPVIVPGGDQRHAIRLLQDESVQVPVDDDPLELEQHQQEEQKNRFVPIKMKEKPQAAQIDPSRMLSGLSAGESRRCKVLDLLFDKEGDGDDERSHHVPPPEPVPGDSDLSVIVFKAKEASSGGAVVFDPDGLKAELDRWKEEVSSVRQDNYELRMKNQALRNERKRLQKKIEVRDRLVESKRTKASRDAELVSRLRREMSELRKAKSKMRRREYNRKAKQAKVAERRRRRREYILRQIEQGNMDRSQLALVYSRKKLPCDDGDDDEPPPAPTATVEYVVDHCSSDQDVEVTYHQVEEDQGIATIITTTTAGGAAVQANEYGQGQLDFIIQLEK